MKLYIRTYVVTSQHVLVNYNSIIFGVTVQDIPNSKSQLRDFWQRVDLIRDYIKKKTANRDELMSLLCQISTSTFSILDEYEAVTGVALYIL